MDEKLFWKRFTEIKKAVKAKRHLNSEIFSDIFLYKHSFKGFDGTNHVSFFLSREVYDLNHIKIKQFELKAGDILPSYCGGWKNNISDLSEELHKEAEDHLKDAEKELRVHFTLLAIAEDLESVGRSESV